MLIKTLPAPEWSNEERANVEVVTELLAAFVSRDNRRIAAMFTPDALFSMGPPGALPPHKPPDFSELARTTRIDIDVNRTAVCGPIVMNDRFDRLMWPGRIVSGRWIGIFVVTGNKVARFTDYTMERKVDPVTRADVG